VEINIYFSLLNIQINIYYLHKVILEREKIILVIVSFTFVRMTLLNDPIEHNMEQSFYLNLN
jgi:hypothetical protein